MKTTLYAFCCLLLISAVNKTDLAVPHSDVEIVFGKSDVTVLGCLRYYQEGQDYYSSWLVKTTDSFFIETSVEGKLHHLNSDSLFNYHFLDYHRLGYYSDTITQHFSFRFSTEPEWIEMNEGSEILWLSTGLDTLFTQTDTFVTDSTPALYSIFPNENDIQKIYRWQLNNQAKELLSIEPFKYSNSGYGLKSYILNEKDSFGNTSFNFHFEDPTFSGDIQAELNNPNELISISDRAFLLQLDDTITIINKTTNEHFALAPNDSSTTFYYFSYNWKDELISTKIIAPIGSTINKDISDKSFLYFPKGDSSIINDVVVKHSSNDIIYGQGSKPSIIKPSSPLKNTVDLSSKNQYDDNIFINDNMNKLTFTNSIGHTQAIDFSHNSEVMARSLNSSGFQNSEFYYQYGEVLSNPDIGQKQGYWEYDHSTTLYQIKDFNDSSFLKFKYNYSAGIIEKHNEYYPRQMLVSTYTIATIHKFTKHHISMFPNPSNGIVNIQSTLDLKGDYTITNMEGKVVQNRVLMGKQFQLNKSLPNGIYFFELRSNSGKERYSGKVSLVR
jgi:hypothetical protein